MIIDDNFIKSFEQQIELLKKLQASVHDAIKRADARLVKLCLPENRGKKVEEVLGSAQSK